MMTFLESARTLVFRGLRAVFRALPFDEGDRDRCRQWFQSHFAFLVPGGQRGQTLREFSAGRDALRLRGGRAIGFREPAAGALPDPLPARCVAFYLPQFHPIAENDAAWGEGFTEWRNVARAQAQFEGHAQPRVAGALGEYDLREPDVLRRQVALAREHGVAAFCFYFYWFAGRRPLELPLQRWLDDPSLDLPFCLCWANESWTRRWDGRERDIILAQKHNADDDLAFITHVSRYLRDPRYLRVDGRPVLVVYRPGLFPAMRDTARRWREHCRGNGIGEIHLAYVQGFERPHPHDIGFDAAIEFPPNLGAPPDIGGRQIMRNPRFRGQIVDWRAVAADYRARRLPDYTLHPGVNAGWDNEPRRPGRGRVYLHASPRRYRDWLCDTIRTRLAAVPVDRRLVFVNAWNEWAEGAILEPDARLGHAWLHAHRDALRAAAALPGAKTPASPPPCAVIHAWYPDVFAEILAALRAGGLSWRLVVTTPPDRVAEIQACLAASSLEAEVVAVENRGRDILPFLKVADRLLEQGVDTVLKLHTKRSPHRDDGDQWRRDILDKLLTGADAIGSAFAQDPRLGLVAPAGHLQPMNLFLAANRQAVRYLVARLGMAGRTLRSAHFVAGSMFWVRLSALRPVLDAHLDEWEFEPEQGQLDGTLAHGVERILAPAIHDAGFLVRDTSGFGRQPGSASGDRPVADG